MRKRDWQAMALAGLTTFAMACGGDQAAEESMGAAQAGESMAAQPADPADPAELAEQEAAEEMAPETAVAMQDTAGLPEGVTAEMISQGQELFTGAGGCHACHNPQATGTQLAPDLTDTTWINVSERNYDEIVSLINSGVPQPEEHPAPMPPMGGANLSEAQVNALAAYIVSLGG